MSKFTRSLFIGIAFLGLVSEVQAQADDVDCTKCVDAGDIASKAVTSGKLAGQAVSTVKIRNKAVTTGKIAGGAVTTGKLRNAAVTSDKLANDAVTTDKLPDQGVTSDKLANDAVTTDKLLNQAVTTDKLGSLAVTGDKLASDAVSAGNIQDGAVTISKVATALSNSIGTFCAPGEIVVGKDIAGHYVCEPAEGPITPVVTGGGIDDTGNIEFRCMEWSDDVCVRPQARVLATSCGSYQDVDVWHDMTAMNSPELRSCPSFCKAVTGDETFVSCAAGIEAAVSSPSGFVATSNLDSAAGCVASNDYRWRIGGAFQAVDPGPAGVGKSYDSNDSSQIANFAALVHGPILSNFCQGCHSPHLGNQPPFHSEPNIADAFVLSKGNMNLNDPASSNFVDRLKNDDHNCWSIGCAAAADDMQAAIEAFAATIPAKSTGRQNIQFSAVGVGTSRLNVECNW